MRGLKTLQSQDVSSTPQKLGDARPHLTHVTMRLTTIVPRIYDLEDSSARDISSDRGSHSEQLLRRWSSSHAQRGEKLPPRLAVYPRTARRLLAPSVKQSCRSSFAEWPPSSGGSVVGRGARGAAVTFASLLVRLRIQQGTQLRFRHGTEPTRTVGSRSSSSVVVDSHTWTT